MLKVALLAPIHNSLYARLTVDALAQMDGVQVNAIVVRNHLNWARFKSEFGRDGARLIGKIRQKYLLGDRRFAPAKHPNLGKLAEERQLAFKSLKEFARQKEIPYRVVNDLNEPRCEALLRQAAPDAVAFTGGGLLRGNILSIPRIGVLNCHTGILPQYRGMDVVEWTAAEGKAGAVGFGATLHLMDAGVDSGAILLKKTIDPRPGEDFSIIRERLEVVMVELMLAGIQKLRDGQLQAQPQAAADGRQYYVMHARVKEYAARQLERQLNHES